MCLESELSLYPDDDFLIPMLDRFTQLLASTWLRDESRHADEGNRYADVVGPQSKQVPRVWQRYIGSFSRRRAAFLKLDHFSSRSRSM